MDKLKPIKRNAALIEFSRDHHHALMLVWKIRHGLMKLVEPSRIAAYIIYFYENDLLPHFKDEEELLFSRLPDDDALRLQAEDEHRNLHRLAALLRANPEEDTLDEFARALESHIRFEERQLFNYLQENISEADYRNGNLLKQRSTESCAPWKDNFWEKKTT